MARHSHSRRSSEERDHAPVTSTKSMPRPKTSETRLPSLSEVCHASDQDNDEQTQKEHRSFPRLAGRIRLLLI